MAGGLGQSGPNVALIGGVVGGVLAFILCCLLLMLYLALRKQGEDEQTEEEKRRQDAQLRAVNTSTPGGFLPESGSGHFRTNKDGAFVVSLRRGKGPLGLPSFASIPSMRSFGSFNNQAPPSSPSKQATSDASRANAFAAPGERDANTETDAAPTPNPALGALATRAPLAQEP